LARTVAIVAAAVLAIRLVGRITMGFVAQSEPVTEDTAERARRPALVVAGLTVAVVLALVGVTVASRAAFHVDPREAAAVTESGSGGRITPAGQHFSLEVPEDWYVRDRSELPEGVAFYAVHLGDLADVSVIENSAGGPIDVELLKQNLEEQFDVLGDIDQGAAELPAGRAVTLSFTAIGDDGSRFDARAYMFETTAQDFVVLVTAPTVPADTPSAVLDEIVSSFRIEA
jgi:hypothetical protein